MNASPSYGPGFVDNQAGPWSFLSKEGLMRRDLRVVSEYFWRNEDDCHLWISASAILHLGVVRRFSAAHLWFDNKGLLSDIEQQEKRFERKERQNGIRVRSVFITPSRKMWSCTNLWCRLSKEGLCIAVGVSRSKERFWKTEDGSERRMLTDLDFLLNVSCKVWR